jgi:hypothetical protein
MDPIFVRNAVKVWSNLMIQLTHVREYALPLAALSRLIVIDVLVAFSNELDKFLERNVLHLLTFD